MYDGFLNDLDQSRQSVTKAIGHVSDILRNPASVNLPREFQKMIGETLQLLTDCKVNLYLTNYGR